MARKVKTLEIEAKGLIRGYADLVGEMKDLAVVAPDGSVLGAGEDAVVEKARERRELPGATARVVRADISATRWFCWSWHARLVPLGMPSMARLHVLGDGASWI